MPAFAGSELYAAWIYAGGTIELHGDYRNLDYEPAMSFIDATAGNDSFLEIVLGIGEPGNLAWSSVTQRDGTAVISALGRGTSGTFVFGPEGTVIGNPKISVPAISIGPEFHAAYDNIVELDCEWQQEAPEIRFVFSSLNIEHEANVIANLGWEGFYYSVAPNGGDHWWRSVCVAVRKPAELDFDGLIRVTLYCEVDYGAGYAINVKIMNPVTNSENDYFADHSPSCSDNTSGTTISNGQTVYVSDTGIGTFPVALAYFSIHTSSAQHGESTWARFKIMKVEWINTLLSRYLTLFEAD